MASYPWWRKYGHWVALAAIVLPLTVLLALQYSWLTELEDASVVAGHATLRNYLEAAGEKTEYFYKKTAAKTLNLPAYLITGDYPEKTAYHFRKKSSQGVRSFFVYSFLREANRRPLLFYDAKKNKMVERRGSPEWGAVMAAAAPLHVMAIKGTVVESTALQVDETDPQQRMILNPILDDSFQIVGVCGMLLDELYFRQILLPLVLEKAIPKYFSEADREDLAIVVRDNSDGILLSTRDEVPETDEVRLAIPFVFSDLSLGLTRMDKTPEQWARSNFSLNMTLSLLLTGVLIGGILLVLRMTSREMHLSQMKADFVSNVSHELRTPISSIRVFAELMRLGRVRDQEKIRDYGEYIEAESRRLTRLINNILDFSRIESGRKLYRFNEEDLAQVVEAALKPLSVRLKHDGFDVTFHRTGDKFLARVDAAAIGQALYNLLDNAVKYSGGSRTVTVRLTREPEAIAISVTDYGIGIEQDEQQKIFDRFHRVGTGARHDVKGSGLGLSIVQHIAESHGGTAEVESAPSSGSTFTLRIPAERAGREDVRELHGIEDSLESGGGV